MQCNVSSIQEERGQALLPDLSSLQGLLLSAVGLQWEFDVGLKLLSFSYALDRLSEALAHSIELLSQ